MPSLTGVLAVVEGGPGLHHQRIKGQYLEGDDVQLVQEADHDVKDSFVDHRPDAVAEVGEGHLRGHLMVGVLGVIQVDAHESGDLPTQRGLLPQFLQQLVAGGEAQQDLHQVEKEQSDRVPPIAALVGAVVEGGHQQPDERPINPGEGEGQDAALEGVVKTESDFDGLEAVVEVNSVALI